VINDLVYDIGTNNGDDTAHYLERGYRVVAIEANPVLTQNVRKRFADAIERGRLQVLNLGINGCDGTCDFWVNEEASEWSSFDRERAGRGNHRLHKLEVATRRLESIMREYGVPYYLKIDIEGFDEVCVESLMADDLPEFVSLEISNLDSISVLNRLGYDSFKCIDQHNHAALISRPRGRWKAACAHARFRHSRHRVVRGLSACVASSALRGVLASHPVLPPRRFPTGSSGPFGDQLPGYWMSADEALHTLRAQCLRCERAHRPLWVDVHACRKC
jgi:FkbM family methyltransferase